MTWILLGINLITMWIALRKRVLPYAIFTSIFIILVVGQAFQIQDDLKTTYSLSYTFSFISERGFQQALWYVFGVSIISLALGVLFRGYSQHSQPVQLYQFLPSRLFYAVFLGTLSAISCILIFVVVGLSNFLNMSRPGMIPGATLFVMLMSIGIFPLLLKILYNSKICKSDIACFALSLAVTGGFSRIHVIVYIIILLISIYYSRGWADRHLNFRAIFTFASFAIGVTIFFFVAGALRDAQNHTQGSISDLIEFSLNNPTATQLSLTFTYRNSIEGMSGVSGAFTQFLNAPDTVHHDYGLYAVLRGLFQIFPSSIKEKMQGFSDFIADLYWYHKPGGNVSPGIEMSFVSFGWAGMLFYPIAFFVSSWLIPLVVLRHRLTPRTKLTAYMFIGCGVFYVRGSYDSWLGYSFAYAVIIFLVWPLFANGFVKSIHNSNLKYKPTMATDIRI